MVTTATVGFAIAGVPREQQFITYGILVAVLGVLGVFLRRWFKQIDDAAKARDEAVRETTERYEKLIADLVAKHEQSQVESRAELTRIRNALSRIAVMPEVPEPIRRELLAVLFPNGRTHA